MTALREPRFLRLLAGQSLSSFGDSALYLSLGIWVKDLTGSNGAAGAVFLALGLPALLSPLTGQLIDRLSRRRILIVTNAITGAVVLSLLFVHSRQQLWILYLVAALYGLSANLLGPATSGLLKDLLPDDELGAANAARQTISQGLRIASPLVGAGLYAAVGPGALAILDAGTFVAAIAAVMSVRIVESPIETGSTLPFRRQLSVGFSHIRRTPILAQVTVTTGLAMLTMGFCESLEFAVAAALGKPPAFFGVMMSVQGAGSILGGIMVAPVLRQLGEPRTLGLGLGGFALGSVGLLTNSIALVCLGLVIFGAAVSVYAVAFGTAIQRHTPARMQGRVSSATHVLIDGPQTFSIALGAVLIGFVDYRLLLLAIIVMLSCTSAYLLLRPAAAPTAKAPIGSTSPTAATSPADATDYAGLSNSALTDSPL